MFMNSASTKNVLEPFKDSERGCGLRMVGAKNGHCISLYAIIIFYYTRN
jgi:hypothetical protein